MNEYQHEFFCFEKQQKLDISDSVGGGNFHVLRNVPAYVFRILFDNDAQQIPINSVEKCLKEMVPKHEEKKEYLNGENRN